MCVCVCVCLFVCVRARAETRHAFIFCLSFLFRRPPSSRPASTLPLTKAMGLDPRVQQDAQEFGRQVGGRKQNRTFFCRHAYNATPAHREGGVAPLPSARDNELIPASFNGAVDSSSIFLAYLFRPIPYHLLI